MAAFMTVRDANRLARHMLNMPDKGFEGGTGGPQYSRWRQKSAELQRGILPPRWVGMSRRDVLAAAELERAERAAAAAPLPPPVRGLFAEEGEEEAPEGAALPLLGLAGEEGEEEEEEGEDPGRRIPALPPVAAPAPPGGAGGEPVPGLSDEDIDELLFGLLEGKEGGIETGERLLAISGMAKGLTAPAARSKLLEKVQDEATKRLVDGTISDSRYQDIIRRVGEVQKAVATTTGSIIPKQLGPRGPPQRKLLVGASASGQPFRRH